MGNSTHLSKIDDLMIRLIGVPGFGILIPNFTGLFGSLTYKDPMYWAGYGYFIGIAFFIWQGNRWFLFKQRENMDWFSQPIRKLLMLVAANVFYTAPLTIALLVGWYFIAEIGVADWDVISVVTLANVICVIFVTHAYETVFLIKERQTDLVKFEQLERAKLASELQVLKSQIDPHFMFNSLNTLSYLIEHDKTRALAFTESLSEVYRYILVNKEKELVTLQQEIEFANHYFTLMRIRFGLGIHFDVLANPKDQRKLLPPISLQLLLENAVKHNKFDESHPLKVSLSIENGYVKVSNNRQPKEVLKSSKVGLKNLQERYQLIVESPVAIISDELFFTVKLPYLSV